MRYLFSAWPEIASRIKTSVHILLLSDYDGTLSPIVDRPELAHLPQQTRKLLQAIAQRRDFTLGIISGRALSDLRDRVGLEGLIYAGNHGLEIEGPGLRFVSPAAEEAKPALQFLNQALSEDLEAIEGAFVEDKGLSLSVHYRLVDERRIDEVRRVFERALAAAPAPDKIRTTFGKKVYEVRPSAAWNKGNAIELLLEWCQRRVAKGRVMPIFLGDDLTDEDGFRTIARRGGVSIFVGEEGAASGASYFVKSATEVDRLLEMLSAPEVGPGLADESR